MVIPPDATDRATLDLVTQRPDGTVVMVLVEQGPWAAEDVEANLRRVQNRLYDCVEVACDGHLARRLPESVGEPAVVRLDCYETPDEPVRLLVQRFEAHVRESDEWRKALAAAPVASLVFEYNWRRLGEAVVRRPLIGLTLSGMRTILLGLAFLLGGAAGAAGCAAVAFFGMFYGLRLACWIAGSEDYMFYMWFGLGVCPAAALGGLACGGWLATTLLKNRLDRQGFLDSEAGLQPAEQNAG